MTSKINGLCSGCICLYPYYGNGAEKGATDVMCVARMGRLYERINECRFFKSKYEEEEDGDD